MSGVYIPGMEMPKAGAYTCELGVLDENTAVLTIKTPINEPQRSYRLIPVPEHGRLIDADALSDMLNKYKREYALEAGDKKDFGIMQKAFGLHYAELMAESLPTIIPADKEGEG